MMMAYLFHCLQL